MQENIIYKLQKEFLEEAISAPKLFRDLGKVEQYIAESYKTRSFIELIQNADDANSKAFGIYSIKDMLIVANDGRPFTVDDIEALCRSGTSNKNRGSGTIGYRGIGFKSVINLARSIYIFSDNYRFCFDKEKTRRLLPKLIDVPLIRVPHPYNETHDLLTITPQLEKLEARHGFTTFFIFTNIDKRIVTQELQEFDRNSLLFLNNICQVSCQVGNIQRSISIVKKHRKEQQIVEIQEGSNMDTWGIIVSPNDPMDMIAFKMKADIIIPARLEESVVHCFTPTIEFAGAYIKINGDYSTDPSRKQIDFDDISQRSFVNALSLLVDTIVDILESKTVRKGFFAPFVNVVNVVDSIFKTKLYKEITATLNRRKLIINGKQVAFSSFRLRPDWLNHEDYKMICTADFCPVSEVMLKLYPELPTFLELVGIKHLYLKEAMGAVNKAKLSVTGAAQITSKIISQYRFDLTKDNVNKLSRLKLFPNGNKLVISKEIKSADELKNEFVTFLTDHVDPSDLKHFFSKAKIKLGATLSARDISPPAQTLTPAGASTPPIAEKSFFKSTPKLTKWRSAEKNALEYLQALEGVLTASDVSMANMGYDIEVMIESGKKIYIEVKSVTSFKDPIKITNNEYSSAHNYADSYYLAIVINDEPFQIKLIPDPINTLSFQKQIERWSWLCENYYEKSFDANYIIRKEKSR